MSDWTPDQPLLPDATDEQLKARYWSIPGISVLARIAAVAREFAAACVAHEMRSFTTMHAQVLDQLAAAQAEVERLREALELVRHKAGDPLNSSLIVAVECGRIARDALAEPRTEGAE